jgi:hypothetical protein
MIPHCDVMRDHWYDLLLGSITVFWTTKTKPGAVLAVAPEGLMVLQSERS